MKPADGLTIIAAAFAKTSAAKTARLAATIQVTSGTATSTTGLSERGTASGVIDFGRQQADITVNAPTGQTIEERLIGTTAYVKLPPQLAATQPQLHGKNWLRQQLPTGGGSLGFDSSSNASDPTSILRLVSKVSDRVDKLGTQSVRGTSTTHYRATVNFAKAATKNGLTAAEAQTLETSIGTSTFPVDLWIDSHGAARRIQFHIPLPKTTTTAPAGQSGQVTETLDLFDFGTPVSVHAPPASQIAPATALEAHPTPTSTGIRNG